MSPLFGRGIQEAIARFIHYDRAVQWEFVTIVLSLDGRLLIAVVIVFVFLELGLFLVALLLISIRVVIISVAFIKQLTFNISEMNSCIIFILLINTSLRRLIKLATQKLRWNVRLFLMWK